MPAAVDIDSAAGQVFQDPFAAGLDRGGGQLAVAAPERVAVMTARRVAVNEIGTAGMPFTHTFRPHRVQIPGTHPPEWDITYPTAIVRAAGYPDAPIDFALGRTNVSVSQDS